MHTAALVLPWPDDVAVCGERLLHERQIYGSVRSKRVVFPHLLSKALFVLRPLSAEASAKLVPIYKNEGFVGKSNNALYCLSAWVDQLV